MNTTTPKPLRRSVIKEELLVLTGDYKLAIILNQLLYWAVRVDDFDDFLLEERQRTVELDLSESEQTSIELRKGWIYKKAEELAEETMLGLNPSNMLRHLSQLVERGWLERRRNPKNKMDKTYQYRVDILKIQRDLQDKGYALEGYPLLVGITENDGSNLRNANTELRNTSPELQNENTGLRYTNSADAPTTWNLRNENLILRNANTELRNENTELRNENTSLQNIGSDFRFETAIPKITSEITSNDDDIRTRLDDELQLSPDGQAMLHLTDDFQSSLNADIIDVVCREVDSRMTVHLGRMYIAKEGDYQAIVDLLASHVPGEFIVHGIDYTFTHFASHKPRSFRYCAEVIKRLWALETEKRGTPSSVDFSTYAQRRRHDQGDGARRTYPRDERYSAFYELFPDA